MCMSRSASSDDLTTARATSGRRLRCTTTLVLLAAIGCMATSCDVGLAGSPDSRSGEPSASMGTASAAPTSTVGATEREVGIDGEFGDDPKAGGEDRGEVTVPASAAAADAAPSLVESPGAFDGVVWLSTEWSYAADGPAGEVVAWLVFLDLSAGVPASRSVPLAGFRPQCFGQLGLVARGMDGVEMGEMSEPVGGASFFVPWGERRRGWRCLLRCWPLRFASVRRMWSSR